MHLVVCTRDYVATLGYFDQIENIHKLRHPIISRYILLYINKIFNKIFYLSRFKVRPCKYLPEFRNIEFLEYGMY